MTKLILTTLLAAVVASAQAPAAKPIPRAANGKPDFSGVWQGGGVSLYGEGGSKGTAAIPQQPRTPGPKPEPLVFQDWAEAKVKAMAPEVTTLDPTAQCLLPGLSRIFGMFAQAAVPPDRAPEGLGIGLSLVSRLLAYIAERDNIQSLKKVLAIPPSAELAPDQEDEKDLMPYVVLDDLLYLYARKRLSLADCWRVLCHRHPEKSQEQLRQWTANFANRFVQNQWKRDQHPVSLKVLDLDLDPKTGFRFPVTQSIATELEELTVAKL